MIKIPEKEEILVAAERIKSLIHHTPVVTSYTLNRMWDVDLEKLPQLVQQQ